MVEMRTTTLAFETAIKAKEAYANQLEDINALSDYLQNMIDDTKWYMKEDENGERTIEPSRDDWHYSSFRGRQLAIIAVSELLRGMGENMLK